MNVYRSIVSLITILCALIGGAGLSHADDGECMPAQPDKAIVSENDVTLEDTDLQPALDCTTAIHLVRKAFGGYEGPARASLFMGRDFKNSDVTDRLVWYVEVDLGPPRRRYTEEVVVLDAMTGKELLDFSYR